MDKKKKNVCIIHLCLEEFATRIVSCVYYLNHLRNVIATQKCSYFQNVFILFVIHNEYNCEYKNFRVPIKSYLICGGQFPYNFFRCAD